jgi:hypothetical protein
VPGACPAGESRPRSASGSEFGTRADERNREASDEMDAVVNLSSDSASAVSVESRKRHGRSRATNHRDLLPEIKDGRHAQARRFRDLVRAFIADQGGIENCTEVKIGLARRLAAATVLSEEIEGKAVNGEAIDIGEFCQLASTTVRLAQRLGVERVPRDVTPTLADILRESQS